MIAVSLNPGFALLFAALAVFLAPQSLRTPFMLAGAIGALFMMFAPGFGDQAALAQIGLIVIPLRLDALGQVFGLGFALVAVILSLFSHYRRDRLEDVALMVQAGGATAAVFAGDLISFIAAAQLSAMAGVALAANGQTPQALGAAIRMLIWQGLAGLLMVSGAGLIWSASGAIDLQQMDARSPGGALILGALLIGLGAPLAHVWVKDAAAHTTPVAAAAIAALPLSVSLYALLRAFPGEPLLLPIGQVMALAPLPFAAMTTNMRKALAYGLVSQAGVAAIGIGAATPLALGGATALGFVGMFHNTLAFLAIGLAYERSSGAVGGLARTMPFTALMALIAGLSAMATPFFAGFAGQAVIAGAVAGDGLDWAWYAIAAASAGAVLHAGLRVPLKVFFGADGGARPADSPFGAQLAMGLGAFFVVSVGVNPTWLYALLPEQINFRPLEASQTLTQAQLIASAGLAFGLAERLRAYPAARRGELADIDRFYGGPLRAAGRAAIGAVDSVGRALKGQATRLRMSARGALRYLVYADRPAGGGALWLMIVAVLFLVVFYASRL